MINVRLILMVLQGRSFGIGQRTERQHGFMVVTDVVFLLFTVSNMNEAMQYKLRALRTGSWPFTSPVCLPSVSAGLPRVGCDHCSRNHCEGRAR